MWHKESVLDFIDEAYAPCVGFDRQAAARNARDAKRALATVTETRD
jgi:hypothetical protein